MRVMKTRVARHPAVAALLPCLLLLTALVASLTHVSCIGQKPNASLLANDITKLGFIPGKPVSLPPDFKAECSMQPNSPQFKVFNFKNGFYIVDAEDGDKLGVLLLYSPITTAIKKASKDTQQMADASVVIGQKVPDSQQTSISFTTYGGEDVFSLTRADVTHIYGPPSKADDRDNKASDSPKGLGHVLEYIFRVGEDDYQAVRFVYGEERSGKEYFWGVGVVKFSPSKNDPLSQYKVYPWPGLYPAPGK